MTKTPHLPRGNVFRK